MQRHGLGQAVLHIVLERAHGSIGRIGLGRHRQIDGGLPQRQIALRNPQEMHRLHGRNRLFQRPRVGQADVLDGHANQPPRDVHAILSRFEHAREPVQRRIHVARPHGFVQRRDQIVVLLAGFVIEQYFSLQRVLDGLRGELPFGRSRGRRLERVVRRAPVAIGVDRDLLQQLLPGRDAQFPQAAFQQRHDLGDRQQTQRIDLRSR